MLRHGEAQGGTYYRGSRDDPLTDLGWQQMQKQTADREWDAVISSPLSRCYKFAKHTAKLQQIPLQIEPDLREICFGEWEGKTAEQIMTATPLALQDFYNNPVVNTPPNGEPFEDFWLRVKTAWNTLLSTHQGQHILIISHAGVIRTLFTMTLDIPCNRGFQIEIPHACLSRFKCCHSDNPDFFQLISHNPL